MTEFVGTKLKNIRLQKGLTLEDVHKKTKIHLDILKAIEEDSLVNFSPVYIKGFLKIYCKFLGVDPQVCIPGYKEPQVAPVKYVSDSREKPLPSLKKLGFKLFPLKAIHIKPRIIFTGVLIVAFIVILFNLGKFFSLKASRVSRGVELPAVSVAKTENKAVVARPQNIPLAKKITLDIHARENCFIVVKCDGRTVFQNILRKGRSDGWQAKDKIDLSLGNAGVVELEVNGRRITTLGRKGQPLKNILITREGLSIKR